MSKFKVGDLITDKKTLVQIIDVKETHEPRFTFSPPIAWAMITPITPRKNPNNQPDP